MLQQGRSIAARDFKPDDRMVIDEDRPYVLTVLNNVLEDAINRTGRTKGLDKRYERLVGFIYGRPQLGRFKFVGEAVLRH